MAEWVHKGNLKGPQGDPGQDAQLPAGGTEGQVLTKTSDGEAWADVPQPDISDVPRLDSRKMKSLHQLGITDLNNVTEPGTYVGASGFGGYPAISNLPDGFMETQSAGIPVFYIDVYRFDTPDDMGLGANYVIQKLYPMFESGVGRAYIRRGSIDSGAIWNEWGGIGVPTAAGNAEVGYVLTVADEYGNLVWGLPSQPDIPLPISQGGTGATTAEGAALMVFAHAPEASPTQAGVVKTLSDQDFCEYMGIEYNPEDWS